MSTWRLFLKCFSYLDVYEKRKFRFFAVCLSLICILDIVGILLVGTGIVNLTAKQNQTVTFLTEFTGRLKPFSSFNEIQFSGFLIAIGSLFLILKGTLALFFFNSFFKSIALLSSKVSHRLVSKIYSKDLTWVQNRSSQQLLYTTGQGVTNLLSTGLSAFLIIVSESFLLVLLVGFLLVVNFWIALFAVVFFGAFSFLIQLLIGNKQKEASTERDRANIKANLLLQEGIVALREVQVYGLGESLATKFNFWRRREAVSASRIFFSNYLPKVLFEIVLVFGLLLVTFSSFVFQDRDQAILTIGFFAATSSRILPSLIRIQNGLNMANDSKGVAALVDQVHSDLFKVDSDARVGTPERIINRVHNSSVHLTVTDLKFKYSGEEFGLDIRNLEIKYGQVVAVIGPSGAGKSTFFDLLLGVIQPSNGEIRITPRVLEESSGSSNHQIGFVSQKIPIFNSTILYNVALNENLSDTEVSFLWDCLRRAGLSGYVSSLPEKLETQLGESGSRISGGQIQRIGLARALFRKPQILLLDEAMNALDPETENFVNNTLESLKGDITIISIVHRMNTLKNADLILYMEEGSILSSGSLSEVLSSVPRFATQYELRNS